MSGFYPVLISISLGIQRVLITVSAAESVYQKSLVVVLLTDCHLTTCDKRCQLQVSYNNDIRVLKFMKSTIFQLPVCLFSFLAELHNVYLLSGERFTQLKPFHLLYPFRWSGHREQKWLLSYSEALRKQFFAPLIQVIGWVASNRNLAFSQRFLGSPRSEHCKLLEENMWRKVFLDVLKTILERDQCFFVTVLL